jgi:hypothetical protein
MKMYLSSPTARVAAIAPAAIQCGKAGFAETEQRFEEGMLPQPSVKAETKFSLNNAYCM